MAFKCLRGKVIVSSNLGNGHFQTTFLISTKQFQLQENVYRTSNLSGSDLEKESTIGRFVSSAEDIPHYTNNLCPPQRLCIVRHPPAANYFLEAGTALFKFPESTSKGVDLRSADLTKLNLTDKKNDLLRADFDSHTKWPRNLPDGFNPEKISELGKNPGLQIRDLHKQGITGKNIGVGIIGMALLVDHVEYKDRLKSYEEIHYPDKEAAIHAPATASIAVGKNTGVAPEADLYFVATSFTTPKDKNGQSSSDIHWVAQSIDRLISTNQFLPEKNKIRVISISLGINPRMNGYESVKKAIDKAKGHNIYVVYVDSDPYLGLGRAPLADPDKFESFKKGDYLKNYPHRNHKILIPMDSRTTASPTGSKDYVFYYWGAASWTVPYVAGLYALACQMKPDITPELFWKTAFDTSVTIKVTGEKYPELGKIINPPALMRALSPSPTHR